MSVEEQAADQRSLFGLAPGEEPYAYLAEMRGACPVAWDPGLGGYLVTRYDDVFTVMSDIERFRLQARPEEQYDEHQSKDRVVTFRNLLGSKTTKPYQETVVGPVMDRLIEAFEKDGRVELHDQFAAPFPAQSIGLLFGLEESDLGDLVEYREARSALFDAPAGEAEELARVSAEWQDKIDARMREILAAHKEAPRDNLLSKLLEMEEDGKPIPDEEIIKIAVRDVLMAGSETATRSTCNAVYRMLSVPGVYEKLRDDRSLVPAFVEESLRYDPPVHVFWRANNEDVELSGCPLAKDSQFFASLAGANRDPEKFDAPDDFDITRKIGRHVTFGIGPHRCPGHWMGRNETERALTMILERLPNLRLDPDAPQPEYKGVILRCWAPLHLLFDPA
jgi:cytochrome P450